MGIQCVYTCTYIRSACMPVCMQRLPMKVPYELLLGFIAPCPANHY